MRNLWLLRMMIKYKLTVNFNKQTISRNISGHDYQWFWGSNSLYKTMKRIVSILESFNE